MVSTIDCGSVRTGSNPVSHPSKFSLLVGGERQTAVIAECDYGYFYVLLF